MKYAKQPIALSQQLKLLEQRGLIIQNEETALSQLQSISHFRLASYWHSMEVPNSDKHRFLPDSNFDDVIELYQFDKKLRTLVFASIQDIEIALRTRIIQWFSLKYGAFWFMDVRLFKDECIFANCLENIQKEVNRSNEDFLKEHFKKYNDPSLPPVWKTMEVISFGTLSKLYCNFNDTGVKKQVAKSFGLPQYLYLESWMKWGQYKFSVDKFVRKSKSPLLCSMEKDYLNMLAGIVLPTQILDYFSIVGIEQTTGEIHISLDEKMNPELGNDAHFESKGFMEAVSVTDFPIRDHKVILKIRRRRWTDTRTGKSFSIPIDLDVVARGTRYSKEFGAFLKETYGDVPCDLPYA